MKAGIYLKLFTSFLKIGAFTFGGGWAMIPIIEREVVDKQQWIKREDFIDALAIAIWFVQVYDNPVIESIFKGIRPAVVALIVSPVLSTAKTARINLKNVIIPIVVALGIWMGGISPIWFVLLGGIGGVIYYNHIISRIKKRYNEKKK